jgi:hypothetical protein
VWPTDDAPLKLFIDSLDQLDDSNGWRRLDWLPATGLPPHVLSAHSRALLSSSRKLDGLYMSCCTALNCSTFT